MNRGATFALAAVGFGVAYPALAHYVRRHRRSVVDRAAQLKLEPLRRAEAVPARALTRAAINANHLGKIYVHGPASALLAGWLYTRTSSFAGVWIVAASVASTVFSTTLKRRGFFRLPPDGRPKRGGKSSFPSGHATQGTAVATAAAYILMREELVSPSVAIPVALAYPVINSAAKVVAGRHWPTDIVGGLALGAAVGCACVSAYELSG